MFHAILVKLKDPNELQLSISLSIKVSHVRVNK